MDAEVALFDLEDARRMTEFWMILANQAKAFVPACKHIFCKAHHVCITQMCAIEDLIHTQKFALTLARRQLELNIARLIWANKCANDSNRAQDEK
jgi:hypothetical protein